MTADFCSPILWVPLLVVFVYLAMLLAQIEAANYGVMMELVAETKIPTDYLASAVSFMLNTNACSGLKGEIDFLIAKKDEVVESVHG